MTKGDFGSRSRKPRKNPVTVAGPWIALSLDFMRSRACNELPPLALKMLIDLCSLLGPNAKGNGDLSAAPALMAPKGWTSNASRVAALKSLEEAGLLIVTRPGDRRSCTLYAVTLWPMSCDPSKLTYGPGSYSTQDWKKGCESRALQPTEREPAVWPSLRRNERSVPAAGKAQRVMNPQRDNLQQ